MKGCTCDYHAARLARSAAAKNASSEEEYLSVAETTLEDWVDPCPVCSEAWELG